MKSPKYCITTHGDLWVRTNYYPKLTENPIITAFQVFNNTKKITIERKQRLTTTNGLLGSELVTNPDPKRFDLIVEVTIIDVIDSRDNSLINRDTFYDYIICDKNNKCEYSIAYFSEPLTKSFKCPGIIEKRFYKYDANTMDLVKTTSELIHIYDSNRKTIKSEISYINKQNPVDEQISTHHVYKIDQNGKTSDKVFIHTDKYEKSEHGYELSEHMIQEIDDTLKFYETHEYKYNSETNTYTDLKYIKDLKNNVMNLVSETVYMGDHVDISKILQIRHYEHGEPKPYKIELYSYNDDVLTEVVTYNTKVPFDKKLKERKTFYY